jgi:hypothetical protein
MINQLAQKGTNKLTSLSKQLINQLNNELTNWLNEWLIHLLIDRLSELMADNAISKPDVYAAYKHPYKQQRLNITFQFFKSISITYILILSHLGLQLLSDLFVKICIHFSLPLRFDLNKVFSLEYNLRAYIFPT